MLRADAARNRSQLLEVATRVFVSAGGTEPSTRAIVPEAGVGIATLCRHFPARESLVDAVYRDQVARLTDGAPELLAQLPPPAAPRRWMDLFGDWIATRNGMLDTLLAMIEPGEIPMPRARPSCSRPSTKSSTPAARRASSAPTSPPKTSLPASSASSPWPTRPTPPGQAAC